MAMGDTSRRNNTASFQQVQASTAREDMTSSPIDTQPSYTTPIPKSTQSSNHPRDDLAAAGGFFVVGLYLSYFPIDAHLPALQGLFQFLAYCCYAVGLLGGMFGLSKLSKNQFFETFGLGF